MNRKNKAIVAVLKDKDRCKEILSDTSGGSTHTDNAGWIVAGLVVVGLVLAWISPWLTGTFFPKVGSTIMGFFG